MFFTSHASSGAADTMRGAIRLAKKGGRKLTKSIRKRTESRKTKGLVLDDQASADWLPPDSPESKVDIIAEEICTRAISHKGAALDGERECLAIFPNQELLQHIKRAVIEHRSVKASENKFDEKLEVLKQQYFSLQPKIAELEIQIAGHEAQSASEEHNNSAEALVSLREKLSALNKEAKSVLERREALQNDIQSEYEELRHKQFYLFEILEDLFPPRNDDPIQPSNIAQPEDEPPPLNHLEHAPGSTKGSQHPTTAQRSAPNHITQDKDEKAAREEREMLHLIKCVSGYVEQARWDLDHRHEKFDRLLAAQLKKAKKGEKKQTPSELGRLQFQETQRLTRALIDAEAQLQEAKQAAIDAGVQPQGSSIESGFVDNVDDGYRESEEKEICESVDSQAVQRWLDNVPDAQQPKKHTYDLRPTELEFSSPAISTDSIEWRPREVEIWESASMVAEGPYRRRIDKWRDMMESSRECIVSRESEMISYQPNRVLPLSTSWGRGLTARLQHVRGRE